MWWYHRSSAADGIRDGTGQVYSKGILKKKVIRKKENYKKIGLKLTIAARFCLWKLPPMGEVIDDERLRKLHVISKNHPFSDRYHR